jgi:hypothetical protein
MIEDVGELNDEANKVLAQAEGYVSNALKCTDSSGQLDLEVCECFYHD